LRANLLACWGNIANLYIGLGQPEEALRWYDKVRAVQEKALRGTLDVQQWAHNQHNRALALGALGRRLEELEALAGARAARRRRGDEDPKSPDRRRDRAGTDTAIGAAYDSLGLRADAERSHRRAVAALEQVVRDNRAVSEYRRNLAQALMNLGTSLAMQK